MSGQVTARGKTDGERYKRAAGLRQEYGKAVIVNRLLEDSGFPKDGLAYIHAGEGRQ